jgi:hypothetical protein
VLGERAGKVVLLPQVSQVLLQHCLLSAEFGWGFVVLALRCGVLPTGAASHLQNTAGEQRLVSVCGVVGPLGGLCVCVFVLVVPSQQIRRFVHSVQAVVL